MSTIAIAKKDEIVMKLVHYFVTKENYTPIVVTGAKDEVWLENDEGPYRIIRINSNYIHNNEQFDFDLFKTKSVVKQIKKKTLSFKVNTLNIFLDLNEGVKIENDKGISAMKLNDLEDLTQNKNILNVFPKIKDEILSNKNGLDLIVNVTSDLNKKTNTENQKYEQVFKPKKPIVTIIIMAICVIMFALMYIFGEGSEDTDTLLLFGANYGPLVQLGQIYRLVTCSFLHIGIIHLVFNMYTLYIIGSQIERFMGKAKYILIYFISTITASLLSIIFTQSISAGASGAIFGLLGSLLYFGYHYRLYLGTVIKKQIIPLIVINLVMGFMSEGVDNAAHIGGLVGGFLATVALGVPNKGSKTEKINGWIVLLAYLAFMIYMVFFR